MMKTNTRTGLRALAAVGLLAAGAAIFHAGGGSLGTGPAGDRPALSARTISAEEQAWVDGEEFDRKEGATEALVQSAARGGQYLTGELEWPTDHDALLVAMGDMAAFCDFAPMAMGKPIAECDVFYEVLDEALADLEARGAE